MKRNIEKDLKEMNGTRELETGRLLLRRYRMDDAALLHQFFGIDEKM